MTNVLPADRAKTLALESLFEKERRDDLSLDDFEAFLDQTRPVDAEQKGANPDQLVRVVHEGKIQWMTHEEANAFLQLADDQDRRQSAIKREIRRALRGETQSLADELSVLFAICASAINRYKQEGSISESDVKNSIEPSLKLRFREAANLFDCIREVEQIIDVKRKQHPIFDQYEAKLGQMLNLKRKGAEAEAAELARELRAKKRKYIMMSRTIEPDVYTNYYYRMELQKSKREILIHQQQISTRRVEHLGREISQLKEELRHRKIEKEAHDARITKEVAPSETEVERHQRNIEQIHQIREKLVGKEMERGSLEREAKILTTHVEDTGKVISHIDEEVLKDSEHADAIRERVKTMEARHPMREPDLKDAPVGKSGTRMATIERRQGDRV
jgi:hypothetical protein